MSIDILKETHLKEAEPTSIGLKLAIAVTEPFQQFYGAVGAKQPWQRLALGFAIASVGMFLSEPSISFDAEGRPRPWKFAGGGKNSTLVHWSIPPLAFGLASAIFI